MSRTNRHPPNSSMTPLWVISLFLSLTEVVTGIAVTQATGAVQVALTVFVIAFPALVASAFFAILWDRPHVLYPPTEFAGGADIESYVGAMRRQGRQAAAAFEIAESAFESSEIEEILRSSLSHSGSGEGPNIHRVVSELSTTAREKIRQRTLTILTSGITGDADSQLLRPYDPNQTVSELLDGLYFDLSAYVQPETYGRDWALRDAKTEEVLGDMGRRWAHRQGMHLDNRLLSYMGIRAGMRLEAVRL